MLFRSPTPSPVLSPAPGTYSAAPSITLSDSNPSAAMYYTIDGSQPTSSSIPYTGAFTLSSTTTVRAVAVAGGISSLFVVGTYTLQIPTLSISASSVVFGNVVVNTPATQSVTLKSTGTAPVTINSAALTSMGFAVSGATFPVTLNPGQAVTLIVQFDPTVTGMALGQLTITSTSSTNGTAVIALDRKSVV